MSSQEHLMLLQNMLAAITTAVPRAVAILDVFLVLDFSKS